MISKSTQDFLQLIDRTPTTVGSWRQVSDELWPHVLEMKKENPGFYVLDEASKRIRLTDTGATVLRYLT